MSKPANDPFKVINYDQYDFDNSTIIKPKTQNFDETQRIPFKTTHAVINSADRKDAYPTPSDYVAELYEEIQDVMSCELKVALLPHNPYNINAANNTLTITALGSTNSVVVTPGSYDGPTLATRLTTLGATTLPSVTGFIVTYDSVTQHFTIKADVAFTVANASTKYERGSILKALGFKATSTTASLDVATSKYVIESTYAADLAPNNMIIMNIDAMNVKSSANNMFNKAFGIIPEGLTDFTIGDVYSIKKTFNPPLARLDKMRIRFTDIYGNPYDFQNKDHILEFAFDSHKNIRKYQAFVA